MPSSLQFNTLGNLLIVYITIKNVRMLLLEPATSSLSHVQSTSSWLLTTEVTYIYNHSCSRGNFANLTRRLFDKQTRKISNVSGKKKAKLNPIIMEYVKSTCFQFFPCLQLDVGKEWSNCVVAIDESCRRLNNKPKKRHETANHVIKGIEQFAKIGTCQELCRV